MMSTSPQHENVTLRAVTKANVEQVRLINSVIFPVKYSDKFYKNLLGPGAICKAAFYSDVMVGNVCARKERIPLIESKSHGEKPDSQNDASGAAPADAKFRLYVMTLGVLAPYRRLKIGSLLLEYVLGVAERDPSIVDVMMHVQVNNQDAVAFYKSRSFEVRERIEGYYERIEPSDCFVLGRKINHSDPLFLCFFYAYFRSFLDLTLRNDWGPLVSPTVTIRTRLVISKR